MKGQCVADTFMEAMKVMRTTPMARSDLAQELGITLDTAERWVLKLSAQGFIGETGKRRQETGGRPVRLFAVTKDWGGIA